MNLVALQAYKPCMLWHWVIIFEGGENHTLNVVTDSSHEVIESHDNSVRPLHDPQLERTGITLVGLTSDRCSWMRIVHIHPMKFQRCSWGSSCANPLKSPFSFKSCNMVLVMWNTTFASAAGKRMTPIPPMRWESLAWGLLTSLIFLMSCWPILLPLLPLILILPVFNTIKQNKMKIK